MDRTDAVDITPPPPQLKDNDRRLVMGDRVAISGIWAFHSPEQICLGADSRLLNRNISVGMHCLARKLLIGTGSVVVGGEAAPYSGMLDNYMAGEKHRASLQLQDNAVLIVCGTQIRGRGPDILVPKNHKVKL